MLGSRITTMQLESAMVSTHFATISVVVVCTNTPSRALFAKVLIAIMPTQYVAMLVPANSRRGSRSPSSPLSALLATLRNPADLAFAP